MADTTSTSKTPNIDAAREARKQDIDADKILADLMNDPEFVKAAAQNRKANTELLQDSSKITTDVSRIYQSFQFIGGLFNPAKVKAMFEPIIKAQAQVNVEPPVSTLSDASGSKTQRSELNKNVKELNDNIVTLTDTIKGANSGISPIRSNGRAGFFNFFRRNKDQQNTSQSEEAAKEKERSKFLTSMISFIGKGFNATKVSLGKVTETVSGIFQGIRDVPRRLVSVIQKTAMAIPNGIVAFTTKLMGGAGQAIGAFITNLGKGFASLGRVKGPITQGVVALTLMSGAIGAFGLAMMAVGKGIELILTGIATGITQLSEAFVKISETKIDGSRIEEFGKTINAFFKTQSFWDTMNGALLRLVPNLENLANSLVAVSKINLDRGKLLDIGKTMNEFLGSFKMENTIGAILTNVFNPENTQKMAEALKNIDGFKLNRENLLGTAETMSKFLMALGGDGGIADTWRQTKGIITAFFAGTDTFREAAVNISKLAEMQVIEKGSTDKLTYFITNITDPVKNLIAAAPGLFAGDVNYLGKIADQVNQLTKIDTSKLDNLTKAAIGVDAVGHMADVLSNLNLGGTEGWFTKSTTAKFADQINALGNIRSDLPFDKLDTFVKLAPGMNAMADAVGRAADAIERLAKTSPITNAIMDNLGTITAADIANRALQAQAANNLTNVVNNNSSVNNTNVTQMVPVVPTKPPSYADAVLNRGR